jgi:trehalose-6-phosphatase
MKFDNGGKREVYAFDLDGTLTNGEPFWEKEPTPNAGMIEQLRQLYQSGNIVIIWTARQWEYAPETVGWLIKNRIPFHGIQMAKGGADHYIDDKMIMFSPDPFAHSSGNISTKRHITKNEVINHER